MGQFLGVSTCIDYNNENKEIHFASGTRTLIENHLESMVL